jgi:hypothetical protein
MLPDTALASPTPEPSKPTVTLVKGRFWADLGFAPCAMCGTGWSNCVAAEFAANISRCFSTLDAPEKNLRIVLHAPSVSH